MPSLLRVLAIDPGTVKCGLAVVESGVPMPLSHQVVALADVPRELARLLDRFSPQTVLLGSGTASNVAKETLASLGVQPLVVDEYGTTLAARARYFQAYPPRGWLRLLPTGLRIPPVPIDDWAAVVMAERFIFSSA